MGIKCRIVQDPPSEKENRRWLVLCTITMRKLNVGCDHVVQARPAASRGKSQTLCPLPSNSVMIDWAHQSSIPGLKKMITVPGMPCRPTRASLDSSKLVHIAGVTSLASLIMGKRVMINRSGDKSIPGVLTRIYFHNSGLCTQSS